MNETFEFSVFLNHLSTQKAFVHGSNDVNPGEDFLPQKPRSLKKFCPRCGSDNVFWASGLPQLWALWECRECGYRGSLIVEDGKLAEKLMKAYTLKKSSSEKRNP